MRAKLHLVLSVAGIAALPLGAVADVTYAPASGDKVAVITVSGQIRKEDFKRFVDFSLVALRDSKVDFFSVELDTVGGDVQTAVAMGRVLRAAKSFAAVRPNGKCFSSCVFILAGATSRYVEGPVGIHRPYAPQDANTTAAAQKQWYERLEKEVKAYLRDVNIPQELYDHMIRIPPERMRILSRNDLQQYGLRIYP